MKIRLCLLLAVLLTVPYVSPVSEASLSKGLSKTAVPDAISVQISAPGSVSQSDASRADTPAETYLERMNLREKICQLFMVTPEALCPEGTVYSADAAFMHGLHKYPVGGILLMGDNISDPEQTKRLIHNMQCYAPTGLLVGVDEEGGCVSRVFSTYGSAYCEDMFSYRSEGTDTAYSNAFSMGKELAQLGFNLDFAPVADVWTNPDNTVIGTRAYSDSYAQAAELVAAAVQGFSDGGVLCTLKHFPGHGDTAEDSHSGAAYTYRTLEEMRVGEFLPFAAGIEAGAELVMAAHISAPALDSEIASMSSEILCGILREELGFDGVIVTDAMNMGAVANSYTSGDAAVRALCAGADLILCPCDLEEAVNGVVHAVSEGRMTETRIDESVLRILTLKEAHGILQH